MIDCPSNDAKHAYFDSLFNSNIQTITFIFITDVDGKQIGLKLRLFGAKGTSMMLFTPLRTTGPPADNA